MNSSLKGKSTDPWYRRPIRTYAQAMAGERLQ